jgi:predicted nucleic acid-binding protein
MNIVFNSSPLIFLSRLNVLSQFLNSEDSFYLPQAVADEINTKQDEPSSIVQQLINQGLLRVRETQLIALASSLKKRLGKGESDAIALGIELRMRHLKHHLFVSNLICRSVIRLDHGQDGE